MGILTVGIVTIPFGFEGRRRKIQADSGLAELRDNVDTLLIICNDKLREMHGNLKISEAFSKADDILTIAAKGIAEIITVAGYINVDFEDVRTVMKDGGTEGEGRAVKAVSQALASPLLNDNDITGANYILLNITSGDEEVAMDEIDEITEYIQNEAGNTADIIWGNGVDESLGNKLSVTIIATGFGKSEPGGFTTASEPKKVVRKLTDDVNTVITAPSDKAASEENRNSDEPTMKSQSEEQKSFEFQIRPSQAPKQSQKNEEPEVKKYTLEDEFKSNEDAQADDWTPHSVGVPSNSVAQDQPEMTSYQSTPEKSAENEEAQIKKTHERIRRLKELSLKIKSPGGINDLEKEPAYKRRNISLDETPHSSESNVSRYTLSEDDDNKTNLRQNNSFLHDNVD